MRYHVSHLTAYEYQASVSISHHQIRLSPRAVPGQQRIEQEIEIDPRPRDTSSRLDYYGNPTMFVAIEGGHARLEIRSELDIEVNPLPKPPPEETPGWENVRDSSRGVQLGVGLDASEFLFDSPLIKATDDFREYAAPSFTKERPILEAALDLTARIYREFKFDPKATDVTTPIGQVLKERRGVCQDFAHLQIACFRSLGLPARYVSGYINTRPPPGRPKLAGADASHAWVSFFCPGEGWIDVDPTNNVIPTFEHITIAWGRDYSDVTPIGGVILGSGGHTLKVSVDVRESNSP